jgi:hypothetical protein
MESQRAIAHLEEQQARITMLLDAARDLLASEQPDRGTALAALRWQLVRALREYQLFKHREIFDPLAGSPHPRLSDMARSMKTRCISVGDTYGAHVQRWSNGAAVTAWEQYTAEARVVVTKIRQHLDRERAEASSLLADVGRTRQAGLASRPADNKAER